MNLLLFLPWRCKYFIISIELLWLITFCYLSSVYTKKTIKSSVLQTQSSGSVLQKKLFGKFSQKFLGKQLCTCLFLNKVTDCSFSSFLKKTSFHNFSFEFSEMLQRTASLKNTCERALLKLSLHQNLAIYNCQKSIFNLAIISQTKRTITVFPLIRASGAY